MGNNQNNEQEKMGTLPFVFSGLSFIPLCGVPFGIASILWGLLSKKKGGKIMALVGVVGIAFTVILYGSLFYFGFEQRGGIYDALREQMAESNLSSLVQSIEFYNIQNGSYPKTLNDLMDGYEQGQQPVFIMDPTSMVGTDTEPRLFYYEIIEDGSKYYLLGVGLDGEPFTSDDILPNVELTNIGLAIHPDSKSVP